MEKQPEYVSLNILKQNYNDWKEFILKKKIGIFVIFSICMILSFTASFIIVPKYTARLSFVMQGEESRGGIADLASQFGLSMGGGSMGAFGGDNLFELLSSRLMVEKTLLKPVLVAEKPTNLLNLYITTYQLNKAWAKTPQLQNLNFPISQNRSTYSRNQDSVLQIICTIIQQKQLVIDKRSKKLSFGDLSFVSTNETLSKMFLENLMSEAQAYYIEIKTKRSRENYERLQNEVDSIRSAYALAINARALAVDDTPNAIRQSASVSTIEKTTEMQYLAATYAEMKKNLELAKVTMNNNTPLIDVVDTPRYPLEKSRFGLLKAGVAGIFCGTFFSLGIYTFLFFRKSLKKGELSNQALA